MYKICKISIRNKDMTYYDIGQGEKVVIFLSGFGVPYPLLDMYNLAKRLENKFRCIIIDRFGYGKSDIVEGARTGYAITYEIVELLIKLNISPKDVIAVGHSLGALYALDIATKVKLEGTALIDYDRVGLNNIFTTKLGYGIYYGLCKTPMKEKISQNMIRNLVDIVEAPKKIKDDARECIEKVIPNQCIKSELDEALNTQKSVIKKLTVNSINKGLLIYTEKNEKENLKLNKYFKKYKNVLASSRDHFVHNSQTDMVADSIIEFFT